MLIFIMSDFLSYGWTGMAVGAAVAGGAAVMASAIIKGINSRRRARAGRKGEKIVAKELGRLRKRDFITINDLLLNKGDASRNDFYSDNGGNPPTSQIDHVVVSSKGVFVVETKNIQGRISGSEHAQYWQQHLSRSSHSFYNPLLQNKSHIKALQKALPDIDPALFVSVVVFTSAWRLDIKADEILQHRALLPDRHIPRTLIPDEAVRPRWWRPGKGVVLDESKIVLSVEGLRKELKRRPSVICRDDLEDIARRIRELDIRTRRNSRSHTDYARATSESVNRGIRQGICPRCGGRLVVVKGRDGEFIGCDNYPQCRFTCSIDCLH